MSHTRAPWVASTELTGFFVRYMSVTGHILAKLETFDCPHEANAKLMAQAPVMLNLLQEEVKYLRHWIDNIVTHDLTIVQMKERIDFIKMTIKAATE